MELWKDIPNFEGLYQAMQIGDITLSSKDSQKLVDFMNYQDKEIERLNNIIKEVREYIENNDLYEQDYDYDYEENLVVGPPSDETARKILLEILGSDKE